MEGAADGPNGCGGSVRWLWPERWNNCVNSPGPAVSTTGLSSALTVPGAAF
jgi:hypothetical protein